MDYSTQFGHEHYGSSHGIHDSSLTYSHTGNESHDSSLAHSETDFGHPSVANSVLATLSANGTLHEQMTNQVASVSNQEHHAGSLGNAQPHGPRFGESLEDYHKRQAESYAKQAADHARQGATDWAKSSANIAASEKYKSDYYKNWGR